MIFINLQEEKQGMYNDKGVNMDLNNLDQVYNILHIDYFID